jgi:hypothetical protein
VSTPVFETIDVADMLGQALVRMNDAIVVLESWPEDDEARQEALEILKAGGS